MNKFYEIKQFGSKAEIRIYGNITSDISEAGDMSATSFNKELSKLNNVKKIDMYFNTPGGSVFEGIAIYNQIKRHKAHFTGYVDGLAASISSVILMACDEVVMPSNAYLMIHNPYIGVVGNQNELRKSADDLERMREASINAYLEKAKNKLNREKVIEIMDNETWLLGSEAYELGLCDRLEEPMNMVASADNKKILQQYNKVPSLLVDEIGVEERMKILSEISQSKIKENTMKVENKMNVYELTKEQKIQKAKHFQNEVLYSALSGTITESTNAVNYELSKRLNDEIAQGIVKGKQEYKQAMLATTGTTIQDGDSFIPSNNQVEVITERMAYNPLLGYITVTNQKNLEEVPKLITSIADDDLIQDGEIAKELELTGSTVDFKRYKSKLYADMSETVALGTNTDILAKTEQSLATALSFKELKLMFGDTLAEDEKHMNFYKNDIKEVSGTNMYEAIMNSIKDLPYLFRMNAIVVMNEDSFNMIRNDLAVKGLCQLDSKPIDLFNRPVVFMDSVKLPIVGDMRYYQINYDEVMLEGYKDIKEGVNTTTLTAWFDAHVLLSSAFRIAKVN